MFKEFDAYFSIEVIDERDKNNGPGMLDSFRARYRGGDYGNGLYRVFTDEQIPKWIEIISEGYPDFEGVFTPFAYDWLGRCFAVDLRDSTKNHILVFEIGTADVLQIPCNIQEFHNIEIPQYNDACLASSFFGKWRGICSDVLERTKCVGYKIPLFRGGKDTVDNLEISDMEVYWSICTSANVK